jgi:hypothetical protein
MRPLLKVIINSGDLTNHYLQMEYTRCIYNSQVFERYQKIDKRITSMGFSILIDRIWPQGLSNQESNIYL